MGLGTQPQCCVCVPSCKLFKNYRKVRHGVTLKYYVMFLQAGHWPSLLCSCHAESRTPRQDTLILHNRWKGNTFIEILWSCHLSREAVLWEHSVQLSHWDVWWWDRGWDGEDHEQPHHGAQHRPLQQAWYSGRGGLSENCKVTITCADRTTINNSGSLGLVKVTGLAWVTWDGLSELPTNLLSVLHHLRGLGGAPAARICNLEPGSGSNFLCNIEILWEINSLLD